MVGALAQAYEVAGVILALPVAAAVVWGIVRLVRHLSIVHEAIIGREATPMSEPIPSMIERFHAVDDWLTVLDQHLTEQDGRLAAVEAEFRTNGGGTLKDDLIDLRKSVVRLEGGQATAAVVATKREDARNG